MRRPSILLLLPVLFCVAPSAVGADEAKASDVVARLQGALIETMKEGATLGFAGRYGKLAPVVKETHGLASVARFALGKYWDKLTEEPRNSFIEKFTTFSIATYAANFESYSGEQFKIVSEKPMERGQVFVRSVLKKSDGGDVQFNYVMEQKEGAWRIVNIIVDGVSDLALKRAEYDGIIAKEGFDALMRKLSQKIDQVKAGAAK